MLFASVALLGCVLAAVTATAVISIGRLNSSSRQNFLHDALPASLHVRDLLLSLVNEETGVRGFIVSGNPSSLRPYHEGKRTVPVDLRELDRVATRHPSLAPLIARARVQIAALERYYAHDIATVVEQGYPGQVSAQVNLDQGERMFDRFRATAAAMDRETARFVSRAESRQSSTYRLFSAILLATASAGLIVTGLLLLLGPRRVRRLYADLERGARASLALETIRDGVVLTGDGGEILYANRAALEVWGAPDDDPTAAAPFLERVLRAGESALGERGDEVTVPIATDSGERWISVAVVRSGGATVYRLRDETQEHELERLRSDFVATASHELRTPVAAIYGAAETLRRTDIELDESTRGQLLEVIGTESESLVGIVEQILFSDRLDRGGLDLAESAVAVRRLAESVVASAASKAPASIRLALDVPDRELSLVSDEGRLRQILANLVENAIKYSPEGGTVEVRVRGEGDDVVLEVADEGIGISTADQERIFEKFYRVDAAMSRGVGGTGLGLYIVRELVARLGGTISVTSEPGRGSTFRVALPARAGQPAVRV